MAVLDTYKNVVVVSEVEFWAAVGKVDQLKVALGNGANPNARDVDGYTALHGAAENGHLAAVRLLLDHGAVARPTTRDGLTPLDLAEMTGHDAVALLLRQHGGD